MFSIFTWLNCIIFRNDIQQVMQAAPVSAIGSLCKLLSLTFHFVSSLHRNHDERNFNELLSHFCVLQSQYVTLVSFTVHALHLIALI